MIFSQTIDLVLGGVKRCTTRVRYGNLDSLGLVDGKPALFRGTRRGKAAAHWIVGHTYAVQRERCHFSQGRIRLDRIEEVTDPLNVSLEIAQAEGFPTIEAYQQVWRQLHKTSPIQPCWRLWFTLISRRKSWTPPELSEASSTPLQTRGES